MFKLFTRQTNNKVVFCGLDNSGKTSIISFMKEGKFVDHTPTLGKEKNEFEIEGTKITILDLAGQSSFRSMWVSELKDAKGCIFVIDKSDPSRLAEAKEEFLKILPVLREEGKTTKILIFLNKADLEGKITVSDIINTFELTYLDNFEILETSAKTGYNIAQAFVKIYSALTGRVLKKFKLAKSIMLYNKKGELIYLEPNDAKDYSSEIIESGLLNVIISNPKMEASIIKIPSIRNGTFIIGTNKKYIGVLLWCDDLEVSVQNSENALKELLAHIDRVLDSVDTKDFLKGIKDFNTNIL